MQLRKSITIPTRLEDEEPVTPNNRNGTKPAHAGLMKAASIPFNPDNPPAAFPSLPLTSKAAPVADKDKSEETATGDSETLSALPTQTSLVGNFSEDEGEEQSHDQTSHIDLIDEQDSIQQDETPEGATDQEIVSLTSSLAAKSSITGTQTGNNDGNTVDQDTTQRHEATANIVARAAVSPNKVNITKSSTTTAQTENTIALTLGQTASQGGRSNNATARATAGQTQAQASSTAANTPFIGCVAWHDLHLSMQYRIFKGLCASHPSRASRAIQILGLTQTEAAQILHAVNVRAMHPASLDEIRKYCLSISSPIPGLQNQLSIDRDIYAAHLDYMIFVAHYDLSSWPKIRLAQAFLAERRLSARMIGTWAPDPLGVPGSEDLVLVPAMQAEQPLALRSAPGTSASSSCAVPGRSIAQASSSRRAREDNKQSSARIPAQNGTFPASNIRLVDLNEAQRATRNGYLHPGVGYGLDPAAATSSVKVAQLVRATQPVARHPLATVSTPGESSTPPRTRQGARQAESSLRSAADSRSLAASSINSSVQAAPPSGLKAGIVPGHVHSSNPLGLEARNAVKETTKATPSAQNLKNFDAEAHPETHQLTSNPATSSHRLVLKVHQKDGLAQVFRKSPPTASNLRDQTELSQSVTASSGISSAAENVPPAPWQFGTTMGNFTRNLLEVPPTPVAVKPFNSTRDRPITRSQGNAGARLTHPTANAAGIPKRKLSQLDIRPDASKIPRMQDGLMPVTPPRGLVPYVVDNVERLHSEAKRTAPANVPMDISGENNSSARGINIVPSCKAVEVTVATVSSSAQAGATDRSLPPSPTFSAISEFEDLPEYQAFLEPVKHRLRVKTSASSEATAADPANVIPDSHLHLLRGIATPGSSASGEASSDSPISPSKKKPPTLKLIVSERSYDPAASGPATTSAKKEHKKNGAYKMTRARMAQEKREMEEALVARAAGIKPKPMKK